MAESKSAAKLFLDLEVLKAEHLDDPSKTGNVNPYVIISLGKNQERTSACKKTMDPVWMDSYFFGKKIPVGSEDAVTLTIWDEVSFGRDHNLGHVEIKLGNVVNRPRETAWFPIEGGRGRLLLEYCCTDHEVEVLHQGYLNKRGGGQGGRANWSTRWFVLTGDDLSYYENEDAFKKGDKPKGVILLNAYFVNKTDNKDKFEFMINSYPKSMCCQCQSEDALKEWMSILNAPLKQFKGLGYD